MQRIGWLQGLPYNTTCCVAAEPATGPASTAALWVGTARGVARRDPSGTWQYFYLQRYLPGESHVVALSVTADVAVVATDGGLALLEAQPWTLAKKAALFEDVLVRHDRDGVGTVLPWWLSVTLLAGLVSGCTLPAFGDLSTCTNHDDDNNGLWTSVVVAAEAYRFAATGDPAARDAALHYYGGMRLLNEITGIPGLMARSAVQPGETHGDGQWHPSTVPKYAGWQWKGVMPPRLNAHLSFV